VISMKALLILFAGSWSGRYLEASSASASEQQQNIGSSQLSSADQSSPSNLNQAQDMSSARTQDTSSMSSTSSEIAPESRDMKKKKHKWTSTKKDSGYGWSGSSKKESTPVYTSTKKEQAPRPSKGKEAGTLKHDSSLR
jgi:hypothetical protein